MAERELANTTHSTTQVSGPLSRRALVAALPVVLTGCVGLRSERDHTPLVVRNTSDTASELRVRLGGEIVEFDQIFTLTRGGARVFGR